MPDAVCTYDPGQKNQLVFEKMIEKGINDIPMIFGSSVGYETLQKYDGPKVHFITSQDKTSMYFLQEQIDQNDLINDSPSIAVMMFQLSLVQVQLFLPGRIWDIYMTEDTRME
mgnify:CR=1 FL=1